LDKILSEIILNKGDVFIFYYIALTLSPMAAHTDVTLWRWLPRENLLKYDHLD